MNAGKNLKNSFAVGLVFSGLSIIFLATALFCQFYSLTRGGVTVFPYAEYVMYTAVAMAFTLVIGIGGLIIGREKKENGLVTDVLLEDLKGEKKKRSKLRAVGYALYGIGLAIFVTGLIYSYLQATDFLSTLVLQGRGQMVFLNSLIPWMVVAIILWAIATLPVTISYRQGETGVTT
jgi:membrane protease YdiL (CAAX protease family)